jgi:transcriptional regulator EpsA
MNSVSELPVKPTPAATFDHASNEHANALVRIIETASEVRRRYQFFVWSQSYLKTLLPHQLAVCGAYQRARKDLVFEAFNSIPAPAPVLAAVTDGASAFLQQIIGHWIERRGRPLLLDLRQLSGGAASVSRDVLLADGYLELLVHGVSRPQRPAELESLFIISTPHKRYDESHALYLELLLPHMHSAWLRVQATEREHAGLQSMALSQRAEPVRHALVTDRESQILFWVREGMSNQQIGDHLGISVLTVKNHMQKILRKLDATNRAQAVAKAMTLNLLARDNSQSPGDDAE